MSNMFFPRKSNTGHGISQRMLSGASWLGCLTAMFVLLFASSAMAQLSGKGAVTGTVVDKTGAVIPGASVSATNNANGITTTTTTTGAGAFNFSNLDPGIYTITTTANGFEKLSQENIHVNAMESRVYNPSLTVGGADVEVTVSAAPPQLETSNATLGATMEQEMYAALPIQMGAGGNPDQRRATDYALLMPGVQGNETNGNATTNTGVVNGSGSRGAASAVYIDGLPFTSAAGEGDPRFVWTAVSVDAVNQFQVQTSGYSALYEGQGVQNYTIKQGSEKYHGSVYEFFRNTALDTWGFLGSVPNPATGKPVKPVEHQNEYGISVSGPVLKNRIFVFGQYGQYRYSRITPTPMRFPTAAEQSGDFSADGIKIYDPNTQAACTLATGAQCRYQFGYMAGTGGAPVLSGAPINQIPAGEISPIAKTMQSFIPTLSNQGTGNDYMAPNASALVNWSMTHRLDYVISAKDTMTLIAAIGRQASSVPVGQTTSGRNIGPVPYNYGQAYAPKTAVWILEETHVFTDHLVNQLKYGFARYNGPTFNANMVPSYAASKMGITGAPVGQAENSFPIVTFSGGSALPTNWGGVTASTAISNSYNLIDNVQWVTGKHSLTFGVSVAWLQYQSLAAATGSTPITLAVTNTETAGFSNATTLASGTGLAYASFLLGQIDKPSMTQYLIPETGARFRPISPYFQDDWKVSPKLTVNLGLRWDYYPTYKEANNTLSFFNPNLTNPVTNSFGAIQYAGHGANTCNCSSLVSNYKKNFGPRLGFAYQMDSKTVWRGSWGVMYTHGNGVGGSAISRTGTGTLGFSAAPAFASSTTSYLATNPWGTATSWNFPTYTPAAGTASGNAYGTGYTTTSGYTGAPSSLGYGDPYYGGRAPQYINWSLGVQRQITPSIALTVSYVGSEGHFLVTDSSNARGYWANAMDPKYLGLGSNLGSKVSALSGGYAAFAAANGLPYYSWFNTGTALSTALKPFPQYGVTDSYGNVANANYHSLQASVNKRVSHGLMFMANYTYARAIDDGGTFRTGYAIPAGTLANHPTATYKADKYERTVSTSNQPQHLVVSGVWALPIGKGVLGGQNYLGRSVLGGFTLSAIAQFYSGSPLALTESSAQTNPAQSSNQPIMNPNFSGPVRVNGKWGHGVTAANLSGVSYVAPVGCGGTNTCSSTNLPADATGPFMFPATKILAAYNYQFSDAPRTAPYNLYSPGTYDFDISLRRSINLHLTESSRLNLQADVYNLTNHTFFAVSGNSLVVGNAAFGTVSGVNSAQSSRDVQLSARIEF